MRKKGFLQISFAWLFAIIVGAVILFLAIFAVTKMIDTQETITSVKTAKEIGVLLNPLETGFEIGQTTTLTFPTETRIYNKCDNLNGVFGKQGIQISQKSFDKWTETDLEVGFANKYIFSENYTEGQTFYIFSKPFEAPFKVSDLIYLTSSKDNYCFNGLDEYEEVKEELDSFNQENIFTENCPDESIKVCFDGSDCEIKVDYGNKRVKKRDKNLYFREDALMYAAIFSNSDIYNCQLQRLMQRVEVLTQIYKDKENFILQRGCNSNLGGDLIQLGNSAKNLDDSIKLDNVWNIVEDIKEKNELNSQCKLW